MIFSLYCNKPHRAFVLIVKKYMKDRKHIETVYDQHSKRLYNISFRIVGNCFDAEEIMHDTFMQYCRSWMKSDVTDLRKWLTSVCIRKSIDKLRERNRYKALLEDYEDPMLETTEENEMQYSMKDITGALSALPDKYRLIISLHLFEGFDYQEIAQITGSKEATIRSIYMRGKQKLIYRLKQK